MATTKLFAMLYSNMLTGRDNDYSARPKVNGTVRNADVAAYIAAECSEYRKGTVENILQRADTAKAKFISEGKTVIDGLGQYNVQIKGVFTGSKAPFDHTKHHLVTSYSAGRILREQLCATEVVTEEYPGGGPVINLISSPSAEFSTNEIPFRGMAVIEGVRIALRGEKPEVGITFTPVDPQHEEQPVFIKPDICRPNTSSTLQFAMPADVTVGEWRVSVATQYSSGNFLSKEVKTTDYQCIVSIY